MVAWRYEIFLLMLKNISRVSARREISYLRAAMLQIFLLKSVRYKVDGRFSPYGKPFQVY